MRLGLVVGGAVRRVRRCSGRFTTIVRGAAVGRVRPRRGGAGSRVRRQSGRFTAIVGGAAVGRVQPRGGCAVGRVWCRSGRFTAVVGGGIVASANITASRVPNGWQVMPGRVLRLVQGSERGRGRRFRASVGAGGIVTSASIHANECPGRWQGNRTEVVRAVALSMGGRCEWSRWWNSTEAWHCGAPKCENINQWMLQWLRPRLLQLDLRLLRALLPALSEPA